jgi:hypothetical protein
MMWEYLMAWYLLQSACQETQRKLACVEEDGGIMTLKTMYQTA